MVICFYEHFKKYKMGSSSFIFEIEKDEDDRITCAFWADELFVKLFSIFGDVVSFDTTYKTNCYNLFFIAFTCINHHGHSIMLGCGLLLNEKIDSFVWLFNKWLEAMQGGSPIAMTIDQYVATTTKAIEEVMATTCHPFCM